MSTFGIVLLCLCSFFSGGISLYFAICWYASRRRKSNPKMRTKTSADTERKSIGTMNLILVIIGITLAIFTICMIRLFMIYGMVPDTLITCVFAALASECGIMGWIKTTKDRKRERKWELEDRKEREKKKEGDDGTYRSDQ